MKKSLSVLLTAGIIFLFLLFLFLESHFPSGSMFKWLRAALLLLYIYVVARRPGLTAWILFSMFAGIEIGRDVPELALYLKKFSDIFLRLIKTIIAPILFSTLVVGIAGHSNLKQVGRMGLKAMLYFEVITTLALIVGLLSINISGAGTGSVIQPETAQIEKATQLISQKKEHDPVVEIFPENFAKAVAEGQVLQVVVFSIFFAIGLALVKNEQKRKPMLEFCESLSEVMFKFTNVVMYFAPFAVGGAIAYSVATLGMGMLRELMMLLLTLYVALIAFLVLVLVPVGLIIKLPFRKFIEAVTEPVSIAFATASSEAALPKAMENMQKMGIPGKIVSFVLPTGYSFNLDGSTLYLSLASVFIAQASGVHLTIWEQVQMCLVLMLTSKGVAGIRGASFLILVSTVASLGLSPEKAFAILAIDAIMDMGRTSVNVIGNCLACVVVAKWEGEFVPAKT